MKKLAVWKSILLYILAFLSMISISHEAIVVIKNDGVLNNSIIIQENKSDTSIIENRTILFGVEAIPDEDASLKVNRIGLVNQTSINEPPEQKREKRRLYHGGGLIKPNRQLMKTTYDYYDNISAVVLGICFGIALKLENVKLILNRPIGLCIAMFCKFVFSPLVSGIT